MLDCKVCELILVAFVVNVFDTVGWIIWEQGFSILIVF